ncbi:MAG TPA: hypothetical protein VI011_05985 [Asanoa sp.]
MSDPVGALLQYGVSWIEHVRPLSPALDWLAGDPGLIAGNAHTWRNVSSSLAGQADALGRYVAADVPHRRGAAAAAYRDRSGRQEAAIRGLAAAADTVAAVTEGAPDAEVIARNGGLTEAEAEQVRQHIFFEEHPLRDDEGGIVHGRYEAGPDMAEAWLRLRSGRHLPSGPRADLRRRFGAVEAAVGRW